MLSSIWDIVLVGRTPLGSALRGAVIGGVLVFVSNLFVGSLSALVIGIVMSAIIVPLVYFVSHRDDGRAVWHDPTSTDDWSSDDRRIH